MYVIETRDLCIHWTLR